VPDKGLSFSFALPDYARWRLLEGLDDIGITLRHANEIADFEQRRPVWLPSSAPAVHSGA
jgi:3-isopropylmalate/(R)-2-methylmalate dehydratase small subunit